MADLIRIGVYKQGASPQVDRAVQLLPAIETLQQQKTGEFSDLETTQNAMQQIAAAWPY